MGSLGDIDIDAILKKAQLLQSLTSLQCGFRQLAKSIESFFAIGIKAQVLHVRKSLGLIAVKRNGGSGKVKGAAAKIGDHFDRIWIGDITVRTWRHHRGNGYCGPRHGLEERVNMFRMKQRL